MLHGCYVTLSEPTSMLSGSLYFIYEGISPCSYRKSRRILSLISTPSSVLIVTGLLPELPSILWPLRKAAGAVRLVPELPSSLQSLREGSGALRKVAGYYLTYLVLCAQSQATN